MKTVLGILLILAVFAQPVFGFHTIPKLFNYNPFPLAIADAILLIAAIWLIVSDHLRT